MLDFEWGQRTSSVLEVRPDGKQITPKHLQMLFYYCRTALEGKVENTISGGLEDMKEVLAFATKDKFEAFLKGYKNKRIPKIRLGQMSDLSTRPRVFLLPIVDNQRTGA